MFRRSDTAVFVLFRTFTTLFLMFRSDTTVFALFRSFTALFLMFRSDTTVFVLFRSDTDTDTTVPVMLVVSEMH